MSEPPPPTPPLAAPSPRATTPQQTNTLVVAGVPQVFFHPLVLAALREHFAVHGELYAWAPLRAFGRIVVVYCADAHAEQAKRACDGLTVDATSVSAETVLRVYRADPTPLAPASPGPSPPGSPSQRGAHAHAHARGSTRHLHPPPVEKNFLISPPGSPPVGWAPVREEPPNATPLAADLIAALRRLQLARAGAARGVGVSVLVEPEEGPGVGVYVEDCESDGEGGGAAGDAWEEGVLPLVPIPTARPPLPTAS